MALVAAAVLVALGVAVGGAVIAVVPFLGVFALLAEVPEPSAVVIATVIAVASQAGAAALSLAVRDRLTHPAAEEVVVVGGCAKTAAPLQVLLVTGRRTPRVACFTATGLALTTAVVEVPSCLSLEDLAMGV